MKKEQVKQIVETTKKGTFVRIEYEKEIECTNGKDVILKRTIAVVRMGISYSNLKSVKSQIETSNKKVGGLPWGEWEQGFENYIINHTKNGNHREYLRVYTTNNHKPKSTYTINGKSITIDELREKELIKESKSKPSPLFVIPLEQIIAIG